mmetsp:Transcript_9559/g.32997  ORF Transcript_9559/g.32997 Transcript_9559/m.32997 type:complete len:215 (-) Transcript_9559:557-1201(-)
MQAAQSLAAARPADRQVGGEGREVGQPTGKRHHRCGWQVHRLDGLLLERDEVVAARGHCREQEAEDLVDRGLGLGGGDEGGRRDAAQVRQGVEGDRGVRRHPRSWWLWGQGGRWQGCHLQVRQGEQQALLRHLPRHAGRRHRIREERARLGGRQLNGDRPCNPPSGGRLHARGVHDPHGRHHEAREQADLPSGAPVPDSAAVPKDGVHRREAQA